jgi:hypothetical protein
MKWEKEGKKKPRSRLMSDEAVALRWMVTPSCVLASCVRVITQYRTKRKWWLAKKRKK